MATSEVIGSAARFCSILWHLFIHRRPCVQPVVVPLHAAEPVIVRGTLGLATRSNCGR